MSLLRSLFVAAILMLPAATLPSSSLANDNLNCGSFTSIVAAQELLNSDPADPFGLDTNRDGVACNDAKPDDGERPEGIPKDTTVGIVKGTRNGTTARIELNGETRSVVLIGVDSPLPGECFGDGVEGRLGRVLVPGDIVYVEADMTNKNPDRYLLRYVWQVRDTQPVLVNEKMIEEGYGVADNFGDNTKYEDRLEQAEIRAQEGNEGLWKQCGGVHVTADASPVATDPGAGTREDPVAIGVPHQVGDYMITVKRSHPEGTEQVLGDSPFNKAPADGEQYYVVDMEISYVGTESGSAGWDLAFAAVGDSDIAYTVFANSCGVVDDDVTSSAELFPDGETKASVCWSVKTRDVDSLVMYIEPLMGLESKDRVFFEVNP